jgi:hypothetical protein
VKTGYKKIITKTTLKGDCIFRSHLALLILQEGQSKALPAKNKGADKEEDPLPALLGFLQYLHPNPIGKKMYTVSIFHLFG